ncbi:MAG: hypothetical protein Q8P25_00045 [Candidatus Curtissbacteria bacterium]|nr:hypothetical protein [Candidatus Curtissbacteria bacterium]
MKSALFFLLFLVSSLLFLVSSFFTPVRAQCDYTGKTEQEIFNDFNKCAIQEDAYGAEVFNTVQIWATIDSLKQQVVGSSSLHPETNSDAIAKNGALAYSTRLVTGLYANPPASGVEYFASQIEKFNPVQPAYAQTGIGYDALTPVKDLWTVFRNASYVGFIIVFVVIGFMVMFRAHISPQAVATIQDSIPRIVIALFLVTFSYAIAGLMIDFMFLILNVIINLLGSSIVNGKSIIDATEASKIVFNKSIFHVIVNAWDNIVGTTAGAIGDILSDVAGIGDLAKIFQWTLGGIGGLIVGIAALFIMFRIFMMLLMAYITIILLTLVAPFFFLIQALPGNNGAKEWFKQMGANIVVFPTVALMIIFAGIITGIGAFGGTGTGTLGAESVQKFPLLSGGLSTDAIGRIIGIGMLFAIPEVATLVKGMFGTKGGPNIGGAVMGGLAAGATAGRQIAGEVAPHTPFIGAGLDRLAVGREMPKMRRQSEITKRAVGKGYQVPGYYQKQGPEENK